MWASGLIDLIGSGSTVGNEFESDFIEDTTDIRYMQFVVHRGMMATQDCL